MFRILIIIVIAICLVSCDKEGIDPVDPTITDPNEPPIAEQGDQEDLQEAMIDFGFKTFLQIHGDDPSEENIIISPLSIETALYMAINGAEEETLNEMREVLEMGTFFPSGINIEFEKLMTTVEGDETDKTYLRSAQATFYNPNLFEIDDDFKSNLENHYSADVYDDRFDLESINGWANEKTNGRIPKVLDKIKDEEFMFVMNALYFLGDWDKPFPPESTRDGNFQFVDGRRPTVKMMSHDTNLLHYKGDDLSAVDLTFADQKYAMTFILPEKDVVSYLDEITFEALADRYQELVNTQLEDSRLLLNLPKFEIKYKRELSKDLKAMGMQRAFDESNAQLGKVGNAGGNIFLTRVIHDTFLKIDEKGAEGAAVTTVGFGVESVPPFITFDRPFLVILRHINSGVPVFIGKISDPNA